MPNISAPLTARPTVYKGVEMRSRLEAHWAQRLDGLGADWVYESRAFADETGQYLPDFSLSLPTERTLYLEVKAVWPEDKIPALQRRMEIIWSSEPDALLMLSIGARVWISDHDAGTWWEQGGA